MPSDASILVVDDHQDTLYALESALAPLGHRMARATSGDEALKQVLRGQVGLLVLDVRMPGVGGLDVVRYLRRLEQTQHIPVILLTGFGLDHELTTTAYALGVADLLMKPVDPWALCTKVRYLYDAHQRQQALADEVRALRAQLRDRPPEQRTRPDPAPPDPAARPTPDQPPHRQLSDAPPPDRRPPNPPGARPHVPGQRDTGSDARTADPATPSASA